MKKILALIIAFIAALTVLSGVAQAGQSRNVGNFSTAGVSTAGYYAGRWISEWLSPGETTLGWGYDPQRIYVTYCWQMSFTRNGYPFTYKATSSGKYLYVNPGEYVRINSYRKVC